MAKGLSDMGRGTPEHYRGGQSGQGEQSGVASAVGEKLGDLAGAVQDFAGSAASQAGDALRSTAEDARYYATYPGDALRDIGSFLRRYPVATLVTGIVLGYCFTKAFGGGASHSWGSSSHFGPSRSRTDYPSGV